MKPEDIKVGMRFNISARNLKNGADVTIEKVTPKSVHYTCAGYLRKDNKEYFLSSVNKVIGE